MSKLLLLTLSAAACLAAEVHTMTLHQAVERALRQSPDLMLARLQEQRAAQQVRVARDPFFPKLFVGSGLAYSNGFPMSIEGSAPSVVQARAVASVFDRQRSLLIEQARENARTAALDIEVRRDEILLSAVDLYLEAERAARNAEAARRQLESLAKVAAAVRLRVSEGRELPLEASRTNLDVARARLRAEQFDSARLFAESSLALVLGLAPGDRVVAAGEHRATPDLPASEESAVEAALRESLQIRRLESALPAKGFEISSHKASRLPRLDLVAQYGVFARFNNYEDFFRKFQRNNGQLGVSFQIPLFPSHAAEARTAQAESEAAGLRLQISAARGRISLDVRGSFQRVAEAGMAAEVARLDLDVTRESLNVLISRFQEGHASLRDVEAARYLESEKWITYYDACYALESARFALLKHTGSLLAALR